MLRGFVTCDLDLNLIGTSCLPEVQCSRRIWILVTEIYGSATVPVMLIVSISMGPKNPKNSLFKFENKITDRVAFNLWRLLV